MATTIVIKNSATGGKIPDASALVTAELALNLTDRKLYSKDAGGNVFEIAGGEGANVPGGDTPPPNGNSVGDLFFDRFAELDFLVEFHQLRHSPS